jgi:phosphorylcholine metabolism protein LicD
MQKVWLVWLLVCTALLGGPLMAEDEEVVQPSVSIARQYLQPIGMPVVALLHSMKDNAFLNYAQQEAKGLEALGDWILTPYRYLMGGSDVAPSQAGYVIAPSCNYRKHDGLKTALSLIALPFSTVAGSLVKGASHLYTEPKRAYRRLRRWKEAFHITTQNTKYLSQGLPSLFSNETAPCLHLSRPSTLSKTHQIEIEAFKEVCALLKKHEIVFWLDCGSALGAYRYQGMIPYDDDIDFSIISDDHQNVRKILETLDPDAYQVQDWSSYLHPQTFIKLYIKKTKTLIDIYHYTLDPQTSQATYFYTYQDTPLPRKWKRMEEVMTKPIPYHVIFPLKRTYFDGIEVWVPNDLEQFLHYKYGENLSPTMVWNEATQSYLKVKNHPYWQLFN